MFSQETVKVLLVEEDTDDCRSITSKLRSQRQHFVIDWADTLAQALAKLGRQSYDIVLADVELTDSDGLSTVAQLRRKSGYTPIIAMTSVDDESMENAIFDVGAQDYLVKGELTGWTAARAILHAVQRQQTVNEMNDLVLRLEYSQQLLKQQANLLRKKNRRLRKLYGAAHEFVDSISHDFRTPLTVIKDYVTIIREGMVGDINAEQQAMLDKVSVRADDLNNMVDDLLDISKLDSGLLGAWRRNVEVKDIIDRCESLLQQRAEVRKVQLVVECDPELPSVYCDPDKVGRVITNLAVNAIKFAGENGRVRLWAEADPAGQQVVVSVSDNGAGIDAELQAKIFERFQQLDARSRDAVRGFGLGLNIAQQLCQLNLGELSLQSEVGKGSTFSFTLPMADPSEVLRRWLTPARRNDVVLRLIRIAIDPDAGAASHDDFDSFLNCLLRTDDLLFRIAPHEWLLVMAVAPSEAERWSQRAEREYERHNRNRPMGPLPAYQAETCYEWTGSDSLRSIFDQFDAFLLQSTATATVG